MKISLDKPENVIIPSLVIDTEGDCRIYYGGIIVAYILKGTGAKIQKVYKDCITGAWLRSTGVELYDGCIKTGEL